MKTIDERQTEILKLSTLKPNVPQFSQFAENHHSAIEAQVWVLMTNPSELILYAHAGEQRWSETVTDAAVEAFRWMEEPNREAMSDDWATLISPTQTR